MRIDKKLNLIIPIESDDDPALYRAYVHSTPVSSQVFDNYFLIIGQAWTSIFTEGLGIVGGTRVADKLLKKVAIDKGVWDGETGVQEGFINEMHRLTNVFTTTGRGWEMIPWDDAVKKKMLSQDEISEIESALVFFTLASLMNRKKELMGVLGGAMTMWGARVEFLSCTEFLNSLRTLTAAENSGVTAAA
jgi:hypothetical protein